MLLEAFSLLTGLVLILLAAEIFTNGIEALGRHFSFSQAFVGSILAAIGTAMPETILPAVAIFLYGGNSAKEIGVGAILGAPFMLSTLAFFLIGITTLIAAFFKKRKFEFNAESGSVRRDLSFFLAMYSLAIAVPFLCGKKFLAPTALVLVFGYFFYAYRTFHGESAGMEFSEEVYVWKLARFLKPGVRPFPPAWLVLLQIAAALAIMVKAAHTFVVSLGHVSVKFGMDPLLFSLLLAPFATELPEKFNSVTWTWKGRDTLAAGNITGAMVFQATFPVSLGLFFTEWNIRGMALLSAALAILSSILVLGVILVKKRITPAALLFGGVLYLFYAVVLVLK